MQRKIIHIDCDCYYAALEVRDFPHLRGKPVAVGGTGPRSVLSTCNYEARKFGIHSAMPSRRAFALCPSLVVQPSRFDVYRSVSDQIHEIFQQYTDKIEPLSLDEAFLDVSDSTWFGGSATLLAEHIRQEIFDAVGITVSAGVAPNKFLAKVCSDWNKPNGLFVVSPDQVASFIRTLPVRKINGVGKKLTEKLLSMGVQTCGDLQQWPLPKLIHYFGKSGFWLYQRAHGKDSRSVGERGQRKSLSIEHTFTTDLAGEGECLAESQLLYDALMARMSKKSLPPIKRIFVKVRFNDFTTTTMERAWELSLGSYQKLIQSASLRSEKGVRLLGLGIRFDDTVSDSQLDLWPQQAICEH